MPNYFTDNSDLRFHFERLNMEETVSMIEHDYRQAGTYHHAPKDYRDAVDNYRIVLEIAGDIAGNFVASRAAEVDAYGASIEDGRVTYATGTREALEQLARAELMGVTLPREYGGLNFPTTVYMMMIEMISRGDASLMNLFGLQDIAETILKYGDDEQREEFLPQFASGESTGAMVLTEPDAGSDLQAVKLHAYQDEDGQWRLRGVKRFITNGCGDILLVLARSEPGTRDARGLSLFVCYGDETVQVRRIENKLGIHGSPTCEMQFNDTPARLIGRRKFGLIKYVMDLMNGARLGVSGQALGISQAAYEAAVQYARDRQQFGKPIYDIPVVTNMLLDMRTKLESNRSLLYATAKWVDYAGALEEKIDRLKAADNSFSEERTEFKRAAKIADLLTPMTKYILTESANAITYDALQIHGGAGYMKEFPVERYARDARITNIYEGTSQMQIVAATGGVMNDILADYFQERAGKNYQGALNTLAGYLAEIREIFTESLEFVIEKGDDDFQDVAARELVEMYSFLFTGYLLLEEAEDNPRKKFIANRYIVSSLSTARKHAESIRREQFGDLLHADDIL